MITCQHIRNLFDRHLDGELPSSLQAELHAHQLNCSECQGELALLEACGDVIAYDRCEPTLSDSFTSRVLVAHQSRLAAAPKRSWSRIIISVAAPLAAAACVGLAVLLITPVGKEAHQSVVAGVTQRLPDGSAAFLEAGRRPSGLAARELAATPQIQPGFMDEILGPVVDQTRKTVSSTRRNFEQLQSLVGLGFAGANEALAAGSRTLESGRVGGEAGVEPKAGEPDMFAPSFPRESSPESPKGAEVDDTVEAL
jgi:hypothetical protein